ncbi:hypothetical protein NADFUDRAFT_48047 [Nadsonia fulvescens var. elongata DSM 6958]|uniref:Uncharacterized protein n=1 Tax=Nadsonia fulvescens var. elongata DSM 6958 TaxID=857566 RepID=A0A1E3PE79_9ASCO|nr:hypothetical protein NADFUDRAFT_48047 [Nadsonia fulvescens var. elongata DSM 6958]
MFIPSGPLNTSHNNGILSSTSSNDHLHSYIELSSTGSQRLDGSSQTSIGATSADLSKPVIRNHTQLALKKDSILMKKVSQMLNLKKFDTADFQEKDYNEFKGSHESVSSSRIISAGGMLSKRDSSNVRNKASGNVMPVITSKAKEGTLSSGSQFKSKLTKTTEVTPTDIVYRAYIVFNNKSPFRPDTERNFLLNSSTSVGRLKEVFYRHIKLGSSGYQATTKNFNYHIAGAEFVKIAKKSTSRTLKHITDIFEPIEEANIFEQKRRILADKCKFQLLESRSNRTIVSYLLSSDEPLVHEPLTWYSVPLKYVPSGQIIPKLFEDQSNADIISQQWTQQRDAWNKRPNSKFDNHTNHKYENIDNENIDDDNIDDDNIENHDDEEYNTDNEENCSGKDFFNNSKLGDLNDPIVLSEFPSESYPLLYEQLVIQGNALRGGRSIKLSDALIILADSWKYTNLPSRKDFVIDPLI